MVDHRQSAVRRAAMWREEHAKHEKTWMHKLGDPSFQTRFLVLSTCLSLVPAPEHMTKNVEEPECIGLGGFQVSHH